MIINMKFDMDPEHKQGMEDPKIISALEQKVLDALRVGSIIETYIGDDTVHVLVHISEEDLTFLRMKDPETKWQKPITNLHGRLD